MIGLLAGPLGPVVIFVLRIVDVSLGTLRLLLVTRGQRLPASLLGFVELLVWLVAAGAAIRNFTSPLHLFGYAGGFGAGTWVGMWLESRFPLGMASVQAYCKGRESGLAEALRALGRGVTELEGEGLEGPVDVVSTVVPRRAVPLVIATIEARDPDAFITVQDAHVRRGWFGGAVRK